MQRNLLRSGQALQGGPVENQEAGTLERNQVATLECAEGSCYGLTSGADKIADLFMG